MPKLLEMAEKGGDSYNSAVEKFQQNYAEKQFKFQYLYRDENTLRETDEFVEFFSKVFFQKILNYFGSSITKLYINLNNYPISFDIMQSIHKYCGETLFELELASCNEIEFTEIKTPFENVETLSIYSSKFANLNSKTLNFTNIFPQLRSLTFFMSSVIEMNSIFQTYPNLEHLLIGVFDFKNKISLNNFLQIDAEHVFRLNPNISSLSLYGIQESFLKKVNNILPNLRVLGLENLQRDSSDFDEISFKNVRSLKTGYMEQGAELRNTSFVKLDEFSISLAAQEVMAWEPIIYQHPELIKLTLDLNWFGKAKIIKYAQHLPNLTHALIKCDGDVDEEIIFNLINLTQLKTLTLINFINSKIDLLQKLLGKKWEVDTKQMTTHNRIELHLKA